MARWTRRLGVLTIILAVCAIANVIAIFLQLGEMHSGGVDTHNLAVAAGEQAETARSQEAAMKAQAKAADTRQDRLISANEKLAGAASTQANASKALAAAGAGQLIVAQDTEQRQLRAYVFVTPLMLSDFAPGLAPIAGVAVQAMGATPAYGAQLQQHLIIAEYPSEYVMTGILPSEGGGGVLESTIVPGVKRAQTTTLVCMSARVGLIENCQLKQSTFAALADGQHFRLYLIGRITYKDTFGHQHSTPFCFSYGPNPATGGMNPYGCYRSENPD